jgi:carbonic anhydrase
MKQILPNKLRLEYQRRPCQTCAEPDPPHADFPHNWGGGSDVIHIDIKVPSEHYLEGKKFDGEFQIFHLHPRRRRSPAIAIPFEVGEHNQHLQKALDEFQKVYDGDLQKCNERNQRERVLKSNLHSNSSMTFPISDSIQSGSQYANEKRGRFLPIQEGESVGTRGAWDPYHEDIVKTIHFWVYEGSTTDPPCGEFVTWFVLDTPFTVSARQLKQIKDLIFTHQDKRCQKTSVHFEESVARPLQSLVGRTISRCTIKDFRSDEVMRLEK